jgi:hypothetical protein
MNYLLMYYYKKLDIALAVVNVAADFFANTKRIIFLSVFYFLLKFCLIIQFGNTILLLITTNNVLYVEGQHIYELDGRLSKEKLHQNFNEYL